MNTDRSVVFVVDDDISVRESLRNLFRSVGLQVETFATAEEFLTLRPPAEAACLVLDVRLPGTSGLDLQRRLQQANIPMPIIFITGHGDIEMSVRAMKAGAVEFLTKPFRDQALLDAVREAIHVGRRDWEARIRTEDLENRYSSLTSREKQVFERVARGLLNKQIADELSITEPTVKLHRGRVMRKMGADSLAGLIHMADKLGLPPLSA